MDQQAIARFRELVDRGIVKAVLARQFSVNIPLKVFNGHLFWEDIEVYKKWSIQRNIVSGHCRILDPDNVRYACGSAQMLSKRIMEIPVNAFITGATAVRDSWQGKGNTDADEQVFAEFRRLAETGKIRERLARQLGMNLEWGTLGGDMCWSNLCECRGWKIQQNRFFLNCRILSPENVRFAWGSKSYLFHRIMGQPVNCVVNYLMEHGKNEHHFIHYPVSDASNSGIVVLIHGWGCRAKNMEDLALGLNAFGYDAWCYDYCSSQHNIPELAQELLENLTWFIQNSGGKKLFLLSHSMGGLLIRKMLELDKNNSVTPAIVQIVMLGPPNRGSLAADFVAGIGVQFLNKSIADMRFLMESEVQKIGVPLFYRKKIGIIAGIFDLKVLPQSSVEIPGMKCGKDYEVIKVSANHVSLKKSYEALSNAVFYFQNGHFPVK